MSISDELWMEEALREALRAQANDEVPVGAIILHQEKIIGRGYNRNRMDCDPSAHAEIVALREAGGFLGNHRLEACEMFVTIEPFAMCCRALTHARLARFVYGARDRNAGTVVP